MITNQLAGVEELFEALKICGDRYTRREVNCPPGLNRMAHLLCNELLSPVRWEAKSHEPTGA
jgi:hypothetical protein